MKQMTAEQWNEQVPVGTPVHYYPVAGAPPRPTRTRSEAWMLDSGHVLVAIEGQAGGVSIEHLVVVNVRGEPDDELSRLIVSGELDVPVPYRLTEKGRDAIFEPRRQLRTIVDNAITMFLEHRDRGATRDQAAAAVLEQLDNSLANCDDDLEHQIEEAAAHG